MSVPVFLSALLFVGELIQLVWWLWQSPVTHILLVETRDFIAVMDLKMLWESRNVRFFLPCAHARFHTLHMWNEWPHHRMGPIWHECDLESKPANMSRKTPCSVAVLFIKWTGGSWTRKQKYTLWEEELHTQLNAYRHILGKCLKSCHFVHLHCSHFFWYRQNWVLKDRERANNVKNTPKISAAVACLRICCNLTEGQSNQIMFCHPNLHSGSNVLVVPLEDLQGSM